MSDFLAIPFAAKLENVCFGLAKLNAKFIIDKTVGNIGKVLTSLVIEISMFKNQIIIVI